RLAGALIYFGDLDAAEAPMLKAFSLDPDLSEVQNTLGEFYFARGRSPDAGKAWARAVDLNPNDPEALSNYATWRWMQIETDGVKEMFRHALELDPLNLERYRTFGSFLAIENGQDEARELIGRMAALFDGATACRAIADIYYNLGDVDKAIAWTIRARDLEPDNRSHVGMLAEYFVDIGEFDTAVEIDPGLGIGLLYKMRRFDEVIDGAEELMIEQPKNIRIRDLLAEAYNATGRYQSAIRVLREIGLPESVFNGWRSAAEWDAYVALMNALYADGRTGEAQKLAQWTIDFGWTVNYDWWNYVPAACSFAVLGRDDEVRAALARLQKGNRIVYDPQLMDAPCFRRFADDPVYQAAVRHFEDLRDQLRRRLPETLADFGVHL
ncbi:MAG TPA: tetratricopeptide repeat protein, partial [Woeseiaceae bacterium]|nr:tetratricopeptide repeat protein [Woeseiaceae bacterium]